MDGNSATSYQSVPQDRKRFTTGLLSLVLLVIDAVVFIWTFVSVGNGVDAGLGLAAVSIDFCFPILIIAGVMSIFAVVKNKGRVPGTIALLVTVAVILVSIWGILSTQVF